MSVMMNGTQVYKISHVPSQSPTPSLDYATLMMVVLTISIRNIPLMQVTMQQIV